MNHRTTPLNTYIHTYTHTYIHMYVKMADEVGDQVENALNLVVSTTEQSGNMKKTLKQKIFETVSKLRSLFVKLRASGDNKTSEINNLTKQVGKLEAELKQCRFNP